MPRKVSAVRSRGKKLRPSSLKSRPYCTHCPLCPWPAQGTFNIIADSNISSHEYLYLQHYHNFEVKSRPYCTHCLLCPWPGLRTFNIIIIFNKCITMITIIIINTIVFSIIMILKSKVDNTARLASDLASGTKNWCPVRNVLQVKLATTHPVQNILQDQGGARCIIICAEPAKSFLHCWLTPV